MITELSDLVNTIMDKHRLNAAAGRPAASNGSVSAETPPLWNKISSTTSERDRTPCQFFTRWKLEGDVCAFVVDANGDFIDLS